VDVDAELVPLLRGQHHAGVGIAPDRHVEEVPRQERALGDERVDELVAHDGLPRVACHGTGVAEEHARLAEVVHDLHDLIVDAVAASLVGEFRRAFEAQHRSDVAHPGQLVDGVVIEERAVGEHLEVGVLVLTREVEQLVPHERLAAEQCEQVDAHVVALVHDLLHQAAVEVLVRRVLRCIAPLTGEVAAHGGAHEDRRRRVVAGRLHEFHPLVDAAKKSVHNKAFNESIAATRAELRGDVLGDQQRRVVILDLFGDETH